MAGLKVVSIKVHPDGKMDLQDLQSKAEQYKDRLAAFMVRLLFIRKVSIFNQRSVRLLTRPHMASSSMV